MVQRSRTEEESATVRVSNRNFVIALAVIIVVIGLFALMLWL